MLYLSKCKELNNPKAQTVKLSKENKSDYLIWDSIFSQIQCDHFTL